MTSSCIRSDWPGNSLSWDRSSSCLSFSTSSSRPPQPSLILFLLGTCPCPCFSRKSLLQGTCTREAEYSYEDALQPTTFSLVNRGHLPPQPRSLEKCPLGGDRTMTSSTPSVSVSRRLLVGGMVQGCLSGRISKQCSKAPVLRELML